MLIVRKSGERGHAQLGWLDSFHSFSFGDYHDPKHMGFRALRVINDDKVNASSGFPTHPHRDMEIISYVVEGELEHKDSLGTGSVIRRGEVQRMSAGTGILHSEYNPSKTQVMRLIQIWILPERTGLTPGYEQKMFEPATLQDQLRLVASRNGREGSVTVHQDVEVYASWLAPAATVHHTIRPDRHVWLQVVSGDLEANALQLSAGDGLQVSAESQLSIRALSDADFLLFDLA